MAEQKEHLVSPAKYVLVLIALMVLLAATIVMAFFDIDRFARAHHLGTGWNTAIAISIAIIKGLLILLFFMHVRYESRLIWAFSAAGFVWLAIMLGLTLTDYFSRNRLPAGSAQQVSHYVIVAQPESAKK